jgi:hypothetical protein
MQYNDRTPRTRQGREDAAAAERHGNEEKDDFSLVLDAVSIIEAHHLKQFGTDRVAALRRAASLLRQPEAALTSAPKPATPASAGAGGDRERALSSALHALIHALNRANKDQGNQILDAIRNGRKALSLPAPSPDAARNAGLEEALRLCDQVESDLKSAHEQICKLQNLDPATNSWPDWSPQANTLRWLPAVREKLTRALSSAPAPASGRENRQ